MNTTRLTPEQRATLLAIGASLDDEQAGTVPPEIDPHDRWQIAAYWHGHFRSLLVRVYLEFPLDES